MVFYKAIQSAIIKICVTNPMAFINSSYGEGVNLNFILFSWRGENFSIIIKISYYIIRGGTTVWEGNLPIPLDGIHVYNQIPHPTYISF